MAKQAARGGLARRVAERGSHLADKTRIVLGDAHFDPDEAAP